jgi:hypothetical protein
LGKRTARAWEELSGSGSLPASCAGSQAAGKAKYLQNLSLFITNPCPRNDRARIPHDGNLPAQQRVASAQVLRVLVRAVVEAGDVLQPEPTSASHGSA